MYSIWEWQIGIQNGTYGITDLDERILWVVLFGLGFAFSGGLIGYFLGGRGNSDFTVS